MGEAFMDTISSEELQALRRDSAVLHALYAGGVDNWEWYSDSLAASGLLSEDDDNDEEDYE